MIRPITCIAFLLACGSGLYLYQTKHRVKVLDDQIAQEVKSTNALREQTRMLSAEWTLLNDPERLRRLANQFLTLQTVAPSQFTSLDKLDSRLPPVAPPAGPETAAPQPAPPVAANDTPPDGGHGDAPGLAGGRPADAKFADAKPSEPKSTAALVAVAPPSALRDGAPQQHVAEARPDDRSHPIDHRLATHSAATPAATADAAKPMPRRETERRMADQHQPDRRGVDERSTDRRLADQRRPVPRRIQPVAYVPPRPVGTAGAPTPAAGGSFLGMAHSMGAPAPVPLPRPMPMNGAGMAYGGTGG